MVKIEIKKKTLDKLHKLFKKQKKVKIKTRNGILKAMDRKMREYLIDENEKSRERNYSAAEINENYFFALFYLRENILGKELNYHKERKRLLKNGT